MLNEAKVTHPSEMDAAVTKLEKFLFNVSFDDEVVAGPEAVAEEDIEAEIEMIEEIDIPSFTEEQVEAARHEGFDRGRDEGIREAADAIETKINDTLGMIGNEFTELFRRQTVGNAETFSDAVNIAVAISRKCFPHFTEHHGLAEVIHMVGDVLKEVLEEPRVIIHVNPTMKEPLSERIGPVAKEANFEGQVLIIDNEEIASGDCRITWSSGSAERDMDSVWARLDQIVEQNLTAVQEEAGSQARRTNADAALAEGTPPPAPEAPESVAQVSAAALVSDTDTAPASSETAAPTQPPAEAAAEAPAPEGLAPVPSDTLAETQPETLEPLETQEFPPSSEADGDLPAPFPAADNEMMTDSNAAQDDGSTEAHLQAGPGIVEPDPNEGILTDGSATDAETADGAEMPPADIEADSNERQP